MSLFLSKKRTNKTEKSMLNRTFFGFVSTKKPNELKMGEQKVKILDSYYDELDSRAEELIRAEKTEEYENDVLIGKDLGENDAILIFEPAWRVIDKDLIAIEGVYGNYDKTANSFEPDWSLTLIYENVPDEDFNPEKWLYFEQDSIATAIHNFLQARGIK